MPGSLQSQSKWLALLWMVSCCHALSAQIHRVDPQKTITLEVAGATAAYSLDESLAEATADNGLVSVQGKQPGTTHVVVVAPSGVQTLEILVTTPPPNYPPGFVMPASVAGAAESGYFVGQFYSSPAQVQSQLDLVRIDGDDRIHVHVVETDLIGPLDPGQSRVALSSASYQIVTPRRDITLFDQYVDESPLSLNGSIVRGFHLQQDNWFVHAGYTSVATFEGLFLPTQPESVAGGGYRYSLTANSSITGSFYHVWIPRLDLMGHAGDIGTVRYKYIPRETFWFTVDLGISRGGGGAGQLYYKTDRDNITALVRYMPSQFASLGANSLRGLHTDLSWTHYIAGKVEAAQTFYSNDLVMPGLRETTISGTENITYRLARHWSLTAGAAASSFRTIVPLGPEIRNFTLPAGLAFQSQHFGASGQYVFGVTPGSDSAGNQFRASLRSGWGAFALTGYAERDTNAPTLNFIFGQVAGLQQNLELQGITATTVQQVDELLSSNSFLIAAGYIKGATINLVPVRTQIGGAASWSSRGAHRKELSLSFLYNDNQALLGSTQDNGYTVAYSQSVMPSDDVSLACSVLEAKSTGTPGKYAPVCSISWKQQLQHVPGFIAPQRHGIITGTAFRDDQSIGDFQAGMSPIPEVEVVLDGRQRTLTRSDGTYRFPNVSRGKHKIVAIYRSRGPFFFTTASAQDVYEDATVNFGIGHLLSGLMVRVVNDAGLGVAGATVAIRGLGFKRNASTGSDGSLFVSSLVAGDYEVQVDEDSLPAGYSAESLGEPQRVTVATASPAKAAFIARALRSISGRVFSYDPTAGGYVSVSHAQVTLREPGLITMTDSMGRYLFRNLAAGSYSVSLQNEGQTSIQTVRLGGQPVDLKNVDFSVQQAAPSELRHADSSIDCVHLSAACPFGRRSTAAGPGGDFSGLELN